MFFRKPRIAGGPARLIDADTFNIPGHGPVRLAGVDAPENGQTALDGEGRPFDAGRAATQALHAYLEDNQRSGWTVCIQQVTKGQDRYGRLIVTVYLEQGRQRTDVCAWMVRHGWAVAEYGPPDYRREERRAQRERLGLWAGEWERPRDWRAARRGMSTGRGNRRFRPKGLGLLSMLRKFNRFLRLFR